MGSTVPYRSHPEFSTVVNVPLFPGDAHARTELGVQIEQPQLVLVLLCQLNS